MYTIKASPVRVAIQDTQGNTVFQLATNETMMKMTAEMLLRFTEQKKQGIDALLYLGECNGLWFEDPDYTKKLILTGTLCFGTDFDKFVEMAKMNPSLLTAKSRFCLQVNCY